jgi:hypothetical protein
MAYSDDSTGKVNERFVTVPRYVNETTTARTLALSDANAFIAVTVAGAATITVPTNASVAFPVGTVITIFAQGAGGVTISPVSGTVTITGTATAAQNICRKIIKTGENTWVAYV